ncbi:MAG: hypothetical protein WAR76_13140 [Xanthobacteraceae bacterium]
MIRKSERIAAVVRLLMFGGCWWWWECNGLWGDDEFQRYVERSDRITMSAGDAKEVNAVTHMYTPWPRGVSDRRIATDGAHMERALERYRRSAEPPDALPNVPQDYGLKFGPGLPPEPRQGTGGGGGGVTPAPYSAQ